MPSSTCRALSLLKNQLMAIGRRQRRVDSPTSRRATFVTMVETAHLREGDDIACGRKLYATRPWAVLVEREMRSGVMMILKIARQDAAQVTLVEDDNVIQTFAADRTDETLDVRVLPGGPRSSDDLLDAHRPHTIAESGTIRFVPVSKQIARRSIPGKGLGHLAGKPVLRGILSDIEVNDPSAVKPEHDQGIEKLERRGDNDKHVDRRNVGQVILQEAPPGRGGALGRHGIHLPTVAWLTLMPSLSSSPWMRGAPHNGLALLMRRIKSRISVPILGRPGRRDRHRQKSRKPLRCHWTTVAGLTNTIASMTCGQIR